MQRTGKGWVLVLPVLLGGVSPGPLDLATRPVEVTRTRSFHLAPEALAEERIRLSLFDGVAIDSLLEERIPTSPGGFLWIGRSLDDESSSLVLSVGNGAISGSLRTAEAQYRIRSSSSGLHRVEELAPSSEPPERQPLSPGPLQALARGLDDGNFIDLLVVYTPKSRRTAGGGDAMAALVALGVGETNLAFERSGVATRLRLVELRELPYREAGRVESDLEILKEESDGELDEVHELRDTFGADLVMLVVEEGDGCGVSYSMGTSGAAFADWAFSVVERGCIDSTYAVAHEVGHNLGCDHAPEDPTTRGAFDYSFGYKDVASGVRTIMAYGPGRRVPRFSNPRVPFAGIRLGSEHQDNARSLNELRAIASGFRQSLPPPRLVSAPGSERGSIRVRLVDAVVPAVREWRLLLGSEPGAADRFDGGIRERGEPLEVRGLVPEETVHARLWYRRGSAWLFEDFML